MFNTRVLSFGILTNEDSINVVVGSLEALDRDTWSDVGKEIECSTESQVEGNVSLSD